MFAYFIRITTKQVVTFGDVLKQDWCCVMLAFAAEQVNSSSYC